MNIKKYFTTKSLAALLAESKQANLKRSLDACALILIGIGAVIGVGIFVISGTAAGTNAGPAIILSFILGALACMLAGLCYAELSSIMPISGGAYTFTYAALGELPAWLVMGMIMLTYGLGAAVVAGGWSGYLNSFLADFGMSFPSYLSEHTGAQVIYHGQPMVAIIDLPALFIVMLLTWVVARGIENASWLNSIIVTIKMTVLSLFIIIGAFYVDPNNWVPFIPENTGVSGNFGISGIFQGAAVVFLAFTGFDAVATTAQEAKNPQRDVPIGILGSLTICALFYIAISAVLTGIVNYKELNVAQPVALAVDRMNMPWLSTLIKIGAISGLTSVVLVMIYSTVRTLFAVTNDGLLPQSLAKLHKKYRTPYFLTYIVGGGIGLLGSMCPLDNLVRVANFGTLTTFAVVCITTLYMRYTMPDLKREFKCPLMPFVPLAGFSLFVVLIFSLPSSTFLYAGIWILILLIIYFGYSCSHSHVLATNQSVIPSSIRKSMSKK